MILKRFSHISLACSTLGLVGYGPMPGTLATLATLPFIYLIHWFDVDEKFQFIFIGLFAVVAYLFLRQAVTFFKTIDPPHIVIDEVVGCLITFCAIPFSWHTLVLGFMLFRFFDIVKPFGITWCEKIGGAGGVLCDDVLAGVLSNVILRLALIYIL